MDVLGVNPMMKNQNQNQKQQGGKRSSKKGIKVVYISTPMKVKTSASEFRALVQELTGRDSDTAGFMETSNFASHHAIDPHQHHHHRTEVVANQHGRDQQVLKIKGDDDDEGPHQMAHQFPFTNSLYEFPASADDREALFRPFDHGDDHFNQLDAFRSFDPLLVD